METIRGEQFLAQLNWRYATKQFDRTRKISPEDWAALENAPGDKHATQKKVRFPRDQIIHLA